MKCVVVIQRKVSQPKQRIYAIKNRHSCYGPSCGACLGKYSMEPTEDAPLFERRCIHSPGFTRGYRHSAPPEPIPEIGLKIWWEPNLKLLIAHLQSNIIVFPVEPFPGSDVGAGLHPQVAPTAIVIQPVGLVGFYPDRNH